MIVGNPSVFAIASDITRAYERLGFRALGYFTLHIGGRRFGVREPDATLLACALDRVEERLARRGTHTASFSHEPAGQILDAILDAIYNPEPRADSFFGLSMSEFSDAVSSSRCEWHRGFDEAFDDGSAILHFDIGDRVRLVADRNQKRPFDWRHDTESLTDVWIPASEFYGVLEEWHDAFLAEWHCASKIPEREDGAELAP
jgi:hypothetical protein